MGSMKAIVICVGDEILKGITVNTNAAYLSEKLLGMGYNVLEHSVVPDNAKKIAVKIRESIKKSDLLIVTGGLGPTPDDRTIDGAAEALRRNVSIDAELMRIANKRMKFKSKELVFRQSRKIENSKIIKNEIGTAQCQYLREKTTDMYLMPGVPDEVKWIMENSVSKKLDLNKEMREKRIKLLDVSETAVHIELSKKFGKKDLEKVSFLPSYGSLVIVAENKNIIDFLKINFKENNILPYGKELNAELIKILWKKRMTLSGAESCTGGKASEILTQAEGSSRVFKGSVIAYSNEIKEKILGVKKETIEKYGAVSAHTAEEMAAAVKEKFKTNISFSITGIAGPGGATREKPLGLVYISTIYKNSVKTDKRIFTGDRNTVRKKSANAALYNLLRRVLNE